MNTFASVITTDSFIDAWVKNINNIVMPKMEMKLLWVVSENVVDKVKPYFNDIKDSFAESELIISPFKVFFHADEESSRKGFLGKRWGVAFNMNIIYQRRKGDLFFLEDDVLPQEDVYIKLRPLAKLKNVGASVAPIMSWQKIDGEHRYNVWYFIRKRLIPEELMNKIKQNVPDFDFFDYEVTYVKDKGVGVESAHASATGCIYINDDTLKDYVAVGDGSIGAGQDVNLGWHITQELNQKYLIDWSSKCDHHHVDEQKNLVVG